MNDDLVLKVAALKVLKDYVTATYDAARAEIAPRLSKGDRLTARSPVTDEKIASVYVTDPERVAAVADPAALLSWVEENYPDEVCSSYKVTASEEQIRRLLFQHAPEWLSRESKVDPEFVAKLLQRSARVGSPVGPGGETDVPGVAIKTRDGVVTCKPDKDTALAAVLELHHAGLLALDGSVKRALTEAEGDVA